MALPAAGRRPVTADALRAQSGRYELAAVHVPRLRPVAVTACRRVVSIRRATSAVRRVRVPCRAKLLALSARTRQALAMMMRRSRVSRWESRSARTVCSRRMARVAPDCRRGAAAVRTRCHPSWTPTDVPRRRQRAQPVSQRRAVHGARTLPEPAHQATTSSRSACQVADRAVQKKTVQQCSPRQGATRWTSTWTP